MTIKTKATSKPGKTLKKQLKTSQKRIKYKAQEENWGLPLVVSKRLRSGYNDPSSSKGK